MKQRELGEEIASSAYPGRGIILGRSADGAHAAIAYFIMGRSENSRNRVFEKTADGIRTKAYDEAKLRDPSLVIYHPVRCFAGKTIVTNGDQTDTICDYMQQGKCYRHALLTRTFEPDPPIFTPRVSGVLKPDGDFVLSILKSADGDPQETLRFFYEYSAPKAGQGRYIHTYQDDGNPPPSFDGEPTPVAICGDLTAFTDCIWRSLHAENKISLYTSFVNLETGRRSWRIYNQNGNSALAGATAPQRA